MKKKQFNSATRFFNKIEILPGQWLKKTSSYSDKFRDEVEWFAKIPENLEPFIPTIKSLNIRKEPYSITYRLLSSPTLHSLVCFSKPDNSFWNHAKKEYKLFLNECRKITPRIFDKEAWHKNLENMYISKTIDRLEKVVHNPNLEFWFKNRYVSINGKKYPSVSTILKYLKDAKASGYDKHDFEVIHKLVTPVKANICFIHGDLVFSNVFIYQKDREYKFKCIDPRGSFGSSRLYGDIAYDYAKIYQSVFGLYDFVLEGDFDYRFDGKNIKYWIQPNNNAWKLRKMFKYGFFPTTQLIKIRIIEALQFLSMVPLHNDRVDHQRIFLCHGIVRFTEAMGKKWKY